MESLGYSIDFNRSGQTMALGSTQPPTVVSAGGGPVLRAERKPFHFLDL